MKWSNNDNYFRMLQMSHRLVSDPNQSKEDAVNQIKQKLEFVKANGMGGIVTNVSYTDYLESEQFWDLFSETMRLCKEMDLRVWLYDENGYPSGGAGGIVVRDNPEYEARGLVCLERKVYKTSHVVMSVPHGHEKVIAAYAVNGSQYDWQEKGEIIDLSCYLDQDGTLCWNSTIDGTVYYIVSKKLFEGVHAARNYHQIRRYVDVLSKDALKHFINVTYLKYKECVGEYFGNTIEAVFTDEPSVMSRICTVLNGKITEKTLDEPDEKIPLYPHIVWTNGFEEIFKEKKGYDIIPLIPMLFGGNTKFADKVRYDYHEVAASLYEEAYFKAISDFCENNNLKFTGHLLGEEMLIGQVIDEYDYFQMMKHMHYTGIDVLTADPKTILKTPLLPKIASSVAHQYGRPTVMSETSDFNEKQRGEFVTTDRIKASVAAQYACGITQINSYFPLEKYESQDFKKMNDSISRIGQVLFGGNQVSSLLVYYPCRSAWQFNIPSEQVSTVRSYKKNFWDISFSLQNALKTFTDEKINYDLTDLDCLKGMQKKNGKFVSPFTQEYNALYISAADLEAEGVFDEIQAIAQNGIKVYIENYELNQCCKGLLKHENIVFVDNTLQAIDHLRKFELDDINLVCENKDDVAVLHKLNQNGSVYMLVNTNEQPISLKATFKESKTPKFIDVDNEAQTQFETIVEGGKVYCDITLSGYQVLFVIFN